MEPLIIAVIGSPGTGKSFLIKELAKQLNAKTILEGEEFPERIIENFKKDTRQMETLLWFRNKGIKGIEKAIELKKQGKTVIMDTYWLSNELHITTMTSGFEQKTLMEQAKIDKEYLPKPDVVIFLDASERVMRNFIAKRDRDFDTNEKFIQRILSIKKAHNEYFKENKESLLYINRDNLDFEKKEDLQKVIDAINRFINDKLK